MPKDKIELIILIKDILVKTAKQKRLLLKKEKIL